MKRRTLAETKEARRKRWALIESQRPPAELSVYGFSSSAGLAQEGESHSLDARRSSST